MIATAPGVERVLGRAAVTHQPGSIRVTLAVAGLTCRLWFNDLSRALGGRRKAVGLCLGLVVLVIAYTVWSTRKTAVSLGTTVLTGAESTYAAAAFSVPALITVVSVVYSPSTTLLTQMLTTLPVRGRAVHFAVRLLTLATGVPMGLLILAPLWAYPVLYRLRRRALASTEEE